MLMLLAGFVNVTLLMLVPFRRPQKTLVRRLMLMMLAAFAALRKRDLTWAVLGTPLEKVARLMLVRLALVGDFQSPYLSRRLRMFWPYDDRWW